MLIFELDHINAKIHLVMLKMESLRNTVKFQVEKGVPDYEFAKEEEYIAVLEEELANLYSMKCSILN